MKSLVVLICLLIISMPICYAKEVTINDLFKVDSVEELNTGKQTYFYAQGKLILSNSGDLKYHYQDRLNSDLESKNLPFGQPISSENRFTFTGKEMDDSLYYFGVRYYDPSTGRFISVDPIEKSYPYVYTHNNPLGLIDPDGAAVGDPMGDGKVENIFGAPVSEGLYKKWSKSRSAYDKIEANPRTVDKVLLWLHPDFDNFEDWHNSLLVASYPDMYYNPNPPENQFSLAQAWQEASTFEKGIHLLNAAIILITMFGGPKAMAMQGRQASPVRPVRGVPRMPVRATPTRDINTGEISIQSTLTRGLFKIDRPGLSPALVNRRGLFNFLERSGTLIPNGQPIRLRVLEDPMLNNLGRMYNRKTDPIKFKYINPNFLDQVNTIETPQLFADRYGVPVTSSGQTFYPRPFSGGGN